MSHSEARPSWEPIIAVAWIAQESRLRRPLLPSEPRPLCLGCVGKRQNMALSIVSQKVCP